MPATAENGEHEVLSDVYRAEKRRGRRPVDDAAKRERERVLRLAAEALRKKDEREFLNALREGGLKDGTDAFARALQIFREKAGRS